MSNPQVTLTTNLWDITLELFPEYAPKTVENFTTHAKNGYYDGVIFHRIIRDFMIQSGDPTGTGRGGESIWKRDFEDEFSFDLTHKRGVISMANVWRRNTNGSQFFIVTTEKDYIKQLDRKHTIFGQVISGMDVVDQIESLPTDDEDRPLSEAKILRATVVE